MKEEKYKKALGIHQDKLFGYTVRIHEIVDEMLGDSVSPNDVLGVLEAEKMYRFNQTLSSARTSSLMEALEEFANIFDEEEE